MGIGWRIDNFKRILHHVTRLAIEAAMRMHMNVRERERERERNQMKKWILQDTATLDTDGESHTHIDWLCLDQLINFPFARLLACFACVQEREMD